MATARPRPAVARPPGAPAPELVEEFITAGLAALTEQYRDDPWRVQQVTMTAAWLRQRDGANAGRRAPRPLPEPLLFRPRSIAAMFETSPKVVLGWAARGEIPCVSIGGRLLIGPRGEFHVWLEAMRRTTAQAAIRAQEQRALIAGGPTGIIETDATPRTETE